MVPATGSDRWNEMILSDIIKKHEIFSQEAIQPKDGEKLFLS